MSTIKLVRDPQTITLSAGSYYFQHAAHPISTQYAYFDHFDPPLNTTHQTAFLCLLDPDLLMNVASDTMQLLSYPRQPLENLSLLDRRNPVRLFEEATQDFVAFQTDMAAQKRDWTPVDQNTEAAQISQEDIVEFMTVHDALMLSPVEVIAALCVSTAYAMGEGFTSGMRHVLDNDSTLSYAIAGHTHQQRFDPIKTGAGKQQVYFNTGSWTTHLALPTPKEVTPELVAWLRTPDWHNVPLRNSTQFTFVLVTSSEGEPAIASLYAWEGGIHRNYHILAEA